MHVVYNLPGSKTGRFCYDHRLSDAMVLIGKIMCIICLVTVATFNFRIEGQEGKVLPVLCAGCAKGKGMDNDPTVRALNSIVSFYITSHGGDPILFCF